MCGSAASADKSDWTLAAVSEISKPPATLSSAAWSFLNWATFTISAPPVAVIEALKAFWSDEEILEFTYITCLYDMHAVMSRALRLEFDDRDEPIVEVPAPKDFDAGDFLGARRRS